MGSKNSAQSSVISTRVKLKKRATIEIDMESSLQVLEEIAKKSHSRYNIILEENQRLRAQISDLRKNQEKIEKTIKKITKSFQSNYDANILTPTAIPTDGLGRTQPYMRRETA